MAMSISHRIVVEGAQTTIATDIISKISTYPITKRLSTRESRHGSAIFGLTFVIRIIKTVIVTSIVIITVVFISAILPYTCRRHKTQNQNK
jgi:hypothetical protein